MMIRLGRIGLIVGLLIVWGLWQGAARAASHETTSDAAAEVAQLAGELDLSAWQAASDEAQTGFDVREMMRRLMSAEGGQVGEELIGLMKRAADWEMQGIGTLLLKLMIPALLWAAARQMLGEGRSAEAAGLVCYLSGAVMMLSEFGKALESAGGTARQIGALSEQVFPILTALMNASGRTGTAGMVQPLISLLGGGLMGFVQKVMYTVGGSAAVLAVIGNLTERLSLRGLFRLCCWAGNWLLGGVMMLFVGMISMSGLLGTAQDGLAMRAAKYAAGSLLPVVGGDIAGTMDSMVYSAALVRKAAGVTGVLVMLGVCLRPIVKLMLLMLAHMLAAALTEPAADGALRRCMEQMGAAIRLLLGASLASAALFILLTGVFLGGTTL